MPKHPKTGETDQSEKSRVDKRLDDALKATFPASDLVAISGVDGVEADVPPHNKPKGAAEKK